MNTTENVINTILYLSLMALIWHSKIIFMLQIIKMKSTHL